MEVLEDHIYRKRQIRNMYEQGFENIEDIRLNPADVYGFGNHWLTCLSIDKGSSICPSDILGAMSRKNIEGRPVWKPMSLQPYYKDCPVIAHTEGDTCESWSVFERGLCLPSDLNMTDSDVEYVIETVASLF